MKKVKINEQEIFDKFHTYSSKDVEQVTQDVQELVKAGANDVWEDSLGDKLLHVIEYCTYNKGHIMKRHGLGVLLFSGQVDDERVRVSWVFSRKEKELWGGAMLIAWNDLDEICCVNEPVTLNGEVLGE